MNSTIRAFFFSLFFISSFTSFSQELKVVYDAQTSKITFYENGKEVSKPFVKQGDPIVLRIENFNNYLYDVNIKETHEVIKFGDGGALAGFGFGDLSQITASMPILSNAVREALPIVTESGDGITKNASLSAEERKILQMKSEATARINQLELMESRLRLTESEIMNYEKREVLKTLALPVVEKIKFNSHLPVSKIKDYSISVLQEALNIKSGGTTINQVMEANNGVRQLTELGKKNEQATREYQLNMDQLTRIHQDLLAVAPNRPDMVGFYLSLEQALAKMPYVMSLSTSIGDRLTGLMETAKAQNPNDVLALFYEYEAIANNDFSTIYRSQGEEDAVVFDVSFKLKPGIAQTDAADQVALSPIKIPVYGGFKMNASIGVSFGQYFNKPKSYFVRDSAIYGQSEGSFLPMLTSFMHFYRQGKSPVLFGGSLGIGIPMGGEVGFNNINFFLGPSLFFGQSERFVFNFGLMGGKVNRLSAGYSEGDAFDNSSEFLPTHQPYELGFYAGLSFNLRG